LANFIEEAGGNAAIVRDEAARGDLLQAASYGFDKLTRPQIGEFMRFATRYGIAIPHAIHKKIASLGPRCFVTTNYDTLIEESLRLWRKDHVFRPPITNRHLTELAEVVHARAIDYVFKPHGDASDADSIILTREQYRQLLPGGERQAALESVKMILASRPIVYFGFSLRDPDFMYIRDLLRNTYKGGTRDHYAIMPDVTEAETDYWRRNYGIHLVSYQTTDTGHGSRDHSALLNLLDELLSGPPLGNDAALLTDGTPIPPEIILALARHAASLTRFVKIEPEFPIRVHVQEQQSRRLLRYGPRNAFDNWNVEQLLDEGPHRIQLIGLPGAGKTYSLKRSAARLGESLYQVCVAEHFDESKIVIPVLVDLKLYQGNLKELVEKTLPSGLTLPVLNRRFKLKLYLDSFNEMPREQWDGGTYEADFVKFIESLGGASVIVGSRSDDGLSKLNFPSYHLDEIDEAFVDAELKRRSLQLKGRFAGEVRSLIQKPFYFQIYTSGRVTLPAEPHARDLFAGFFESVRVDFETQFAVMFDLERALSRVAYEAINHGEEAQPLTHLQNSLATQLNAAGIASVESSEITNWLVSKALLIPYTGGRIAFFHQSVTEYLAASELARRYQTNPDILREKLSLTRWDQALFLTLSLLPQVAGKKFLRSVMDVDFVLALRAAKYLESGRDEVVSELLSEVPERYKRMPRYSFQIEGALDRGVPVNDVHEPQLREIMKLGDSIGGTAAKRLAELKGPSVKAELLQSLFQRRDDYNYCANGAGPALCPLFSSEDWSTVLALIGSLQDEVTAESDEDVLSGFISGLASMLESTDLSEIRDALLSNSDTLPGPELRGRILCDILWHRSSTAALELAADLLLRGVVGAATAIYFIARFPKDAEEISWNGFNGSHVDYLISMIEKTDERAWSVQALRCICSARTDLAKIVTAKSSMLIGLRKAILQYCSAPEGAEALLIALSDLAMMSADQRRKEPIALIKDLDIDWRGHEALFVRLLTLWDVELTMALLTHTPLTLENLDIGPIEPWLDWLLKQRASGEAWWLQYRFAELFAESLLPEYRNTFLQEFNRSDSKYRTLLAHSILRRRNDLTTDDFTNEAISFLLKDLNNDMIDLTGGNIAWKCGYGILCDREAVTIAQKKAKDICQ